MDGICGGKRSFGLNLVGSATDGERSGLSVFGAELAGEANRERSGDAGLGGNVLEVFVLEQQFCLVWGFSVCFLAKN